LNILKDILGHLLDIINSNLVIREYPNDI